ncbi:hypothetical protein CPC08DRAFT_766467 [Agrocybe pediades]|nr:hypothetical protein CPC08DRAFT_766467 [Agrocybe pediades]
MRTTQGPPRDDEHATRLPPEFAIFAVSTHFDAATPISTISTTTTPPTPSTTPFDASPQS